MKRFNPFLFYSQMWMAFIFLCACASNNTTSELQPMPEPPPFNPDYFRNADIHYHAVRIKFKDHTFQLANNKVFKMPGRAINLKNFPTGKFNVTYLNDAGQIIDEISTASPLEILKEEGYPEFKKATVVLIDSLTFFLPLPNSAQTKKLKIQANSFLPVEITIPDDTLDISSDNQSLIPDSSVFRSPKKSK